MESYCAKQCVKTCRLYITVTFSEILKDLEKVFRLWQYFVGKAEFLKSGLASGSVVRGLDFSPH